MYFLLFYCLHLYSYIHTWHGIDFLAESKARAWYAFGEGIALLLYHLAYLDQVLKL